MYEAKLTGLKAKDVLNLIDAMPAHVTVKFAQTAEKPAAKSNGRSPVMLDDYIMLGDAKIWATVREGTMHDFVIKEVQAYEKKHGAGEMTKRKLRDTMKKHSAAPDAVVGTALKNGVIKGTGYERN